MADALRVYIWTKANRLCDSDELLSKTSVPHWFRDVQSKHRVRSAVESVLDKHLPESYGRSVFTEKCNNVFDLMVDYASQGLKWAMA